MLSQLGFNVVNRSNGLHHGVERRQYEPQFRLFNPDHARPPMVVWFTYSRMVINSFFFFFLLVRSLYVLTDVTDESPNLP